MTLRKLSLVTFFLTLMAIPAKAQQVIPIVSGNATIDRTINSGSAFTVFVTSAVTVNIINQPTSSPAVVNIIFIQDSTGHAVTFSAAFTNAPTVSTSASSSTATSFQYAGNSNSWYGLSGSGTGVSQVSCTSGCTVATPTTTPAITVTAAGGNVTGPISSTTNDIATYADASGVVLADGGGPLPASKANVSHQWLNTYTLTTGLFTSTQPGFADISGSASCLQLPSLTGDATTTAGNCATTVVALNGTNLAGLASGFLFNTTTTGVPSTVGSSGTGNVCRVTSCTMVTPALGTPTSVNLANATFPASIALTANPLSQFASTTSAQLAGVISDETGSGAAVFGTSPTISSATLGGSSTVVPNGATVTIQSGGTLTCASGSTCPSGTGTVTHTAGALTANGPIIGNGGADVAVVAPMLTNQVLTGVTSSAPVGAYPGVTVNANASATPSILGDGGSPSARSAVTNTTNGTTSTAATIAAAGSTGFPAGFVTALCNLGTVVTTLTPATSTVNGNATAKLVPMASGANPECLFLYDDGTNYSGPEILPTDANGRLQANGFPALTGDITNTPGALATTIAANAVTGAKMANNTVTATQLAAQYSKGSCTELWGGSGTSFALTSGDDAVSNNSCYNDSGVTRTITAVKCRGSGASNTTTVNPTFGAAGTGTTILSGALTCGSSFAYSSTGTVSNASWTTGTGITPAMGGTLTGVSIAMIVEFTY